MELILFWAFAGLMIIFGTLTAVLRNPVSSALSLVVTFVALAALYIQLDAFFVGIVQILVYAGAIMVLFLFIIMLLDLKAEAMRKANVPAYAGGFAVVGVFIATVIVVLSNFEGGNITKPELSDPSGSDVASLGTLLFEQYFLPFQIIGVLLMVSAVGVVVLSKRKLS